MQTKYNFHTISIIIRSLQKNVKSGCKLWHFISSRKRGIGFLYAPTINIFKKINTSSSLTVFFPIIWKTVEKFEKCQPITPTIQTQFDKIHKNKLIIISGEVGKYRFSAVGVVRVAY